MGSSVEAPDWSAIPEPKDDGAARHLTGMRVASAPLPATDGTTVDLSSLPGRVVVYAYPRTGVPGFENPPGWDLIAVHRGYWWFSARYTLGLRLAGLPVEEWLFFGVVPACALLTYEVLGRGAHGLRSRSDRQAGR